ncbi:MULTISPECIES: folate-binding protein YgfZ [Acidobacterium]|uniref:CAF17-like 4Fe-4S cluster assembly/insertion protein YgfZ n=1 Tax=Acidobacterium TaxID=33973 RepID=UPI00030AB5CD|nr:MULTISPECIES: folate-binding protein YgfZ [Acidobacterium]HCT60714.1 folate-binding protein [Acidobacterium sp.]
MVDTPAAISPLALHLAEKYPGAEWSSDQAQGSGRAIVRRFGDAAQELHALLSTAAVFDLAHRSLLSIRGGDQQRWLNGMITNTIKDLPAGHSNYSYVLNAQGRILGDLTACRFPDHILLVTDETQVAGLAEHFDHFIIMDDVELEKVQGRAAIGLAGPEAALLLERAGLPLPEGPLTFVDAPDLGSQPVLILQEYGPVVPRFTLWMAEADAPAFWDRLAVAGMMPAGADALEMLRLLEGVPQYGVDFSEKYLPQEVDGSRPLHFNKGCYLGQEIVERIRSRATVHRQLRVVELTGTLPALPAPVEVGEAQAIGEITSAAALPGGPRLLGLAMLRNEAMERQQTLTYEGGTLRALDAAALTALRTEILSSAAQQLSPAAQHPAK